MTTPYESYNRGAIALAEHFDIGRVPASDFVLENNPYPNDENWTLFEPSNEIDYDALNGREVKLVYESETELTFTMRRSIPLQSADTPFAWAPPLHIWQAFRSGWDGGGGWYLYIKGGLPTKRVTADTLEPGDIVNLHSEDTGETWEHAVCVAPAKSQ